MTYAELYASPIQHPWLLWAAALLGLLTALRRRDLTREVRWFCIALTALSLVDAWLTANSVIGFGPLRGPASSWVPLLFVLLGDFRYFLFIETAGTDGTIAVTKRALALAAGWMLAIPVSSQLVLFTVGSDETRVLFLVYEMLFVMLSLGLYAFYLPRRSKAASWTRDVTLFVILYYALWAVADAIILFCGTDEGFLLRMLPNVLYYGGLVPTVAWTAPDQAPSGPGITSRRTRAW